ncbi:hypothetical protein XI06_02520 [Bradyrhizobium sp. CCBAU 11434]|uniref:hypothetical protein n=1 Tax=Bradyrhizobium sp. CCBAU 11434 TaxID=1630885 RepID=UPI002306C62F|nr:hypothetical protein [Bradyrhizobium sp. CCBAU 11434]MDA9519249.1 hypothetical protein [Bradyrhizobium sp. CCBAU 11434]
MKFEVVEHEGRRYAEIIRAGTTVDKSVFFSPAGSSFQFGLLAHGRDFVEPAHYHPTIERKIDDLQQMFVVQKGVVAVDFFSDGGVRFHEVVLRVGDAILLIHGAHSVRVLEDMQCVSVKQGPFLGADRDKVEIGVQR